MPANLSIKMVPDEMVERLRVRAEQHHRSMQGELLAILEEAVGQARPMSAEDVLAEIRRQGIRSPSESATIVRADRDGR